MESIINKLREIKRIEKRILEYKQDKIDFMTNGEMEYLRIKCDKNQPISKNELNRYARAVGASEKVLDLEIERDCLKKELNKEIKVLKCILQTAPAEIECTDKENKIYDNIQQLIENVEDYIKFLK